MPSRPPTNCFRCKGTWTGRGPICNTCLVEDALRKATAMHHFPTQQQVKDAFATPPPNIDADAQQYIADAMQYIFASGLTMPRSRRPGHWAFARPSSGRIYSNQPLLRTCPACKGNYLIESKAGTVCAGCKTVVHNACRNCTSTNTHGLFGDKTQFLECGDCQFIE